jgi:hypothetical protein
MIKITIGLVISKGVKLSRISRVVEIIKSPIIVSRFIAEMWFELAANGIPPRPRINRPPDNPLARSQMATIKITENQIRRRVVDKKSKVLVKIDAVRTIKC